MCVCVYVRECFVCRTLVWDLSLTLGAKAVHEWSTTWTAEQQRCYPRPAMLQCSLPLNPTTTRPRSPPDWQLLEAHGLLHCMHAVTCPALGLLLRCPE